MSGATPTVAISARGYSAISVSNTVSLPGRMVKRNAAAALWLSSSACTTTASLPLRGRSSQKERNVGNSSPAGSAVLIASPRADRP